MLKIKKKKVYDFKYKIYWRNGRITEGTTTNSKLKPNEIFLDNSFTYFANGCSYYYNSKEIDLLEITDLVEKVKE